MEDKRKKPKTNEVKNKIKSGAKSYHDCCAKVGCRVKKISKPKIPIKPKPKIPTKPKKEEKKKNKPIIKRKPFITPEQIVNVMEKDDFNRFEYNKNTVNRRGDINKIVVFGEEYCDRILKMSKYYSEFKNNDFKVRTYTKPYPFDFEGGVNSLDAFVKLIARYKKDIVDIRKDCGEQEANIIDRIYNDIIENKEKIQNRLKKNTPEFLKENTQPKPTISQPKPNIEVKKVFKPNIKSYRYKTSKDGKVVYISQSWWNSISQIQKDRLNEIISKLNPKPRKSSKEMIEELMKATQSQPITPPSQPKPIKEVKTDKEKELEKDRQRLRIRKNKIIDSYLIDYYKLISNSSMELLEKSLKKGDIKDDTLRKAWKKNNDKYYKEFVKVYDDLGFKKGRMRIKWTEEIRAGKVTLLRIVSKHANLFKRKLTNEQITTEKEWLERNFPNVYKII